MTSSKPFFNTNPRWQSALCQRSERIRRIVENNGVSETRAYNTDNTLASINFAGASIGNLTYGWDANKNKTSESHTASWLPSPRIQRASKRDWTPSEFESCFPSPRTQQASCSESKSHLPSPRTRGEGAGVRGSSIKEDRSLVLTRTHGPTHELLTAGGQNISTDVKGNITFTPASLRPTASSLTSVWDFDNRLNTADVGSDGSVDVTYKFDALGRRVFRDNGTTATIYVQAGQQTIADYTASSAPSSPTYRYVYASYIDEPVLRFKPSGSESLYYHRNQQYSVVALTNSSAAIVERYAYSAYGVPTITNASGTLLPVGSVDNRYLYTGREWDQTLSLYHYRARMYDANLGRFVSRDPIGYSDNASFYFAAMTAGRLDPSGLSSSVRSDCHSLEDSFKISIFNEAERGRLNDGVGKYFDGLSSFFKKARKKIPLPEIDFSMEVAWKTRTRKEECACNTTATKRYDEVKVSAQFNMNWNAVGSTPPGTWINIEADFHLNSTFERESGGCFNIDNRYLCVKAGGEISISFCGGVPDLIQGCVKASLECNVGFAQRTVLKRTMALDASGKSQPMVVSAIGAVSALGSMEPSNVG